MISKNFPIFSSNLPKFFFLALIPAVAAASSMLTVWAMSEKLSHEVLWLGRMEGQTTAALKIYSASNAEPEKTIWALDKIKDKSDYLSQHLSMVNLRLKAFTDAGITRKDENYSERVSLVDTSMADKLLMDSLKYLNDYPLYILLDRNKHYFDPKTRKMLFKDKKSDSEISGYIATLDLHNTLKEEQIIELQICYKKLNEKFGDEDLSTDLIKTGSLEKGTSCK